MSITNFNLLSSGTYIDICNNFSSISGNNISFNKKSGIQADDFSNITITHN
jgi:hypothetical protein